MPHPKTDPAIKVYGVCGCVPMRVKRILEYEATKREKGKQSLGSLIGEILADWAEGKRVPEDNKDQYQMFQRTQEGGKDGGV